MATTKTVILEALEELLIDEFKDFKWRLSNSDAPIPRGSLETAERREVVDLMVQRYGKSHVGKIAVKTLRDMKQNELAGRLNENLQKVPEDVPAGAGASSSGTPVPAQTAGVTVNISSNGGTVKAPVVHGCNVTGAMTFN